MAVQDDIRRSVGYASIGFGAVAVLTPVCSWASMGCLMKRTCG